MGILKKVRLAPLFHRGHSCIGIYFSFDQSVNNAVRKFPGRLFSATNSCWYVVDAPGVLDKLIADLSRSNVECDVSAYDGRQNDSETLTSKVAGVSELPPLSEEHRKALRMAEQQLNLKGYSANTRKTYQQQFKEFLCFYGTTSVLDITEQEIRNYLLYLVEKKRVSRSTQNQVINAIKFFYERVLKQERKVYHLERPLKERRLPEVLSPREITGIFEQINNIKHKVMMMLIYSAGLRRSELLQLRVGDVDIDRKIIFIRGGKGRKDRQTMLAQSIVPLLKTYLEQLLSAVTEETG